MAERIYVVPVPGNKVPDYEMNDFIPAGGRTVLRTIHITRRLNDGSLVIGEPPTPAVPPPAAVDPESDPPTEPEDPPRRGRTR